MLNIPPVDEQAPIAITHFGSAIWSYTCLKTGAIFCETLPATIIKSACLGDALKTSIPYLAKSYLALPAAIISIAQHARPKVTGHIDCVRDHLTALSIVVVRMLSGVYIKLPL